MGQEQLTQAKQRLSKPLTLLLHVQQAFSKAMGTNITVNDYFVNLRQGDSERYHVCRVAQYGNGLMHTIPMDAETGEKYGAPLTIPTSLSETGFDRFIPSLDGRVTEISKIEEGETLDLLTARGLGKATRTTKTAMKYAIQGKQNDPSAVAVVLSSTYAKERVATVGDSYSPAPTLLEATDVSIIWSHDMRYGNKRTLLQVTAQQEDDVWRATFDQEGYLTILEETTAGDEHSLLHPEIPVFQRYDAALRHFQSQKLDPQYMRAREALHPYFGDVLRKVSLAQTRDLLLEENKPEVVSYAAPQFHAGAE